jgi:hypothetical protein
VGVVEQGSSTIVSVVLLERARSGLELEAARMDSPVKELDKTERIVVEWCRAPEKVYRQLGLMVDSDQDYDILSSFWNTKGYEFAAPVISAKQPLEVHFGLRNPELSNKQGVEQGIGNLIIPTVSMEDSSVQGDPSITCDDSMILSVSTWDGESHNLSQHKRRSHGPNQLAGSTASKIPSIHKFQLQQTLRCKGCYQVFSRDPNQFTIPVMSQSCGHTICRGCVVRKADQDYEFAEEYQSTVSCPLCHASNAFSQELHINHSLCSVIALIDP